MKLVSAAFVALLTLVESADVTINSAPRNSNDEQARRKLIYVDPETHMDTQSTAGVHEAAAMVPEPAAGTCGNGIVENGEECDSGNRVGNSERGNGAPFDPCASNCQWKYDTNTCQQGFREIRLYVATDEFSPDENAFFMTTKDGGGDPNLDVLVMPIGFLEADRFYEFVSCADPRICHFVDFYNIMTTGASRRDFDVTLVADGVLFFAMTSEKAGDMQFFKRRQFGQGCPDLPNIS